MNATALCKLFPVRVQTNFKTLRVMKLTAILFLTACLQVAARTEGQTVTLSVKDVPVKKVFREIQKQTGLNFFVEEAVLTRAGKVTLQVKDMPVAQVIDLCLPKDDYSFTIVDGTIVIKEKPLLEKFSFNPGEEPPPPIDVHGKVLNEKGEAIEGVTVTVKGTRKATVTDANGEFTLKAVNENATLVFTSINVETYEVAINNRRELSNISLKTRISAMGDVTVGASTGYQTISKERATGAFDVVGRDILDKRPVADISTASQVICSFSSSYLPQ